MKTKMKTIEINYSTELSVVTFKPLKIITLTIDLEGLQNLKVTQGAENTEKEISETQELIKQIIKGE